MIASGKPPLHAVNRHLNYMYTKQHRLAWLTVADLGDAGSVKENVVGLRG